MNSNISPVTIEFCDQPLITLMHNDVPHVAMRPICEGIGLNWASQYQKIKRHQILNSTVVMITTVAEDLKTRKTLCLPLSMLNGWLFGVDANRVKVAIRDRLIKYQKECFQVLWQYWTNQNQQPVIEQSEPVAAEIQPVNITSLPVMEYQGRRVIISKNLMNVLGLDEESFNRLCANNDERLKEGDHYFKLHGRDFIRNNITIHDGDPLDGKTRKFWTSTGVSALANMINTGPALAGSMRLGYGYFMKNDKPVPTTAKQIDLPLASATQSSCITISQENQISREIESIARKFHCRHSAEYAIQAAIRERFNIINLRELPTKHFAEAEQIIIDIERESQRFLIAIKDMEEKFITQQFRTHLDFSLVKQLAA